MEEVINSIRRASELVQNLQQDLPNLANQPETLSLSIDQITQAFTDAKEKLLLISRHTQTSESPPMLLHETTPQQPQMDATLIQEWLRSSHAVTMDQMFQMQLASMAGREVEDSERTIGSEGDQGQGIHASSSRPRRSREGNQEKKKILVPAPQFGNTEMPPEDGFTWRKYGQKEILGSKYPRSYYRCTHQKLYECQAKKMVQRLDHNANIFEVTYRGKHTCHMSSTAPSSVPPEHILVDITQNTNTISSQLSPSVNLTLHPATATAATTSARGGPSTSRYAGDYPVLDMADAMFNSGSSSGNNSMEFLFSPTEDKSDAN
ncbi:WRKY transcription factor 55 isoform X2 [Vigna radiata var. radiata]|uniref:WRKY transcription factor 55 isoform X2 n=1 Tax=Vigna radiata var. radiata TaxID=3916 RepID=A0A3Q0EW74_VIGRR|nr:WRKY transcription factor 55 isoform X2 [Vigna radiata var. radiata]